MPVSIYDSSIIVKSSSSSSSSTMRLTDFSGTPYWMAPESCEGLGFLFKKVFNGLPNVEERYEEAKALHDGTSSQITAGTDTDSVGPRMKTRRISGWKFNDVNSSLTQNSVLSQKMMQLLNFSVLEAKP
ncbi:hypothetical protein D5086_018831 [Populus alba]|uniref:Uncharacterized protein n=1 Tax=Populus alba TaxID=43335 RepID=A0ACC4BS37_POPAL